MKTLAWRSDSRPGVCAVIVDEHDGATPFAAVLRDDVLRLSPGTIAAAGAIAPRLIAWSGSLADEPGERDPRTWGPAGLAALREALARLREPLVRANARLLLRPHARHVLCDPQRCVTLLNEWEKSGDPFALALDPAAMIEESMHEHAEDHARRAIEAVAGRAEIVILSGSGELAEMLMSEASISLTVTAQDSAAISVVTKNKTPPA